MTADAYRPGDSPASFETGLMLIRHTLGHITKIVGYSVLFTVYVAVFIVSIGTLALIEIRQANLNDFNALIAILEQKDHYSPEYIDGILAEVIADTRQYQHLDNAPSCEDASQTALCAQIKADISKHSSELWDLQQGLVLQKANLAKYYDEYTDGLRKKTPQLIPVLWVLESRSSALTLWARSPMELLEMLLLVFMGALGGIIGVTRYFVEPSTPNPAARDLCYRPVAGAVIALGIYVLFRAAQMLVGGVSQDTAATVSTSVFLLAALGLASGFCAREAVAQIEATAIRILRRSENATEKQTRDNGGTNQ